MTDIERAMSTILVKIEKEIPLREQEVQILLLLRKVGKVGIYWADTWEDRGKSFNERQSALQQMQDAVTEYRDACARYLGEWPKK